MSEPIAIIEVFHDDAEGSYSCRLRPSKMPAEGYGVVLYDLARQVSKMFAKEGIFDEALVLARILEFFDREREHPSSEVSVHRLDS